MYKTIQHLVSLYNQDLINMKVTKIFNVYFLNMTEMQIWCFAPSPHTSSVLFLLNNYVKWNMKITNILVDSLYVLNCLNVILRHFVLLHFDFLLFVSHGNIVHVVQFVLWTLCVRYDMKAHFVRGQCSITNTQMLYLMVHNDFVCCELFILHYVLKIKELCSSMKLMLIFCLILCLNK